ncbi:MAG: hypothetical protein KDK51_05265 [Deltaproteobacteria bacterium]|nr:hypothetical protein [Deltaproteobacteria bacterium]
MIIRWRRKTNIVYPGEQISYALEYVYIAIGFVSMFLMFFFIPPFSDFMNGGVDVRFLFFELKKLIIFKWSFFILVLIILFCVGILMSNRIWGPIYGFIRVIEGRMKGETVKCRFRKYDHLALLGAKLNEMFEQEDEKSAKVKALLVDLDKIGQAYGQDIVTKVQELKEVLGNIHDEE